MLGSLKIFIEWYDGIMEINFLEKKNVFLQFFLFFSFKDDGTTGLNQSYREHFV